MRTCSSLGVKTSVCRRGKEAQWYSPPANDGAYGRVTKVGNGVLVALQEAVGVRSQPAVVVVVVRIGTHTLAQKKNL